MFATPSQFNKVLLLLLTIVLLYYIYMDINLYLRIQYYPVERYTGENITFKYNDVSWFGCDISPLCVITVKGLLLDHTNLYLFSPLATIVDRVFEISQTTWITPNIISYFHVFIAFIGAKCIAHDTLSVRRIGVVLFQVRTFLDGMDGHVARVRKHIKGERSEIGTSGYYIDGICDLIGCVALMIGTLVYLKNNPPRGGYVSLQTDNKNSGTNYKPKVTTNHIAKKICYFSMQLMISSTAWNRYIAIYQDVLERNDVKTEEFARQNIIFQSVVFLCVTWIWRIFNLHNMIHSLLLVIFCDKLWKFLKSVQYIGLLVLMCIICVTEFHILEVKNFIFHNFTDNIQGNV